VSDKQNNCYKALQCLYISLDGSVANDVNYTVKAYLMELESHVRDLEAELETEKDHSKFSGELVQHLYGDGWENLTIHEAKKLRARHSALVEAAKKSEKTFYKMLHHFAGNLDYPKEYRKYIDQLSSELKAAIAEVKG
jgi:hypothetical protein